MEVEIVNELKRSVKGYRKCASLDDWLANAYFEYHAGLYKSRPIYWHVASAQGTSPFAFGTLVHYHRFDKNRMQKLRASYVRDTIEELRRDAGLADKAGRADDRVELQAKLEEVQALDKKLQLVQEGHHEGAEGGDRDFRIILIPFINIPFIVLGYKVIGKIFAIKASATILGLAIALAFFHFPEVTHDKLLVSIFGRFFLGAGIGMSVRGGGVLDGTEVLAIYISRKAGATIGDIITVINVVIFSTAAYFLSIDTALYSMLTYLAASKTLDFVVEGIDEYTGVTIVSSHSEELRMMIMETMGRGVTVYKGKRGYGKKGHNSEFDIIYTVITRLEISKLKLEIEKIDPNAFVLMNSVKDTVGGMIK